VCDGNPDKPIVRHPEIGDEYRRDAHGAHARAPAWHCALASVAIMNDKGA